ncbi:hypothetical protein J6590_063382 [Homalodisca vitripennis]|nr:hypothetical protein J6590_007801 [Homalodisca vitripennis]KAG8286285.1 hypothetical protein J6590_063382 [Homalodisca vitripennis]
MASHLSRRKRGKVTEPLASVSQRDLKLILNHFDNSDKLEEEPVQNIFDISQNYTDNVSVASYCQVSISLAMRGTGRGESQLPVPQGSKYQFTANKKNVDDLQVPS